MTLTTIATAERAVAEVAVVSPTILADDLTPVQIAVGLVVFGVGMVVIAAVLAVLVYAGLIAACAGLARLVKWSERYRMRRLKLVGDGRRLGELLDSGELDEVTPFGVGGLRFKNEPAPVEPEPMAAAAPPARMTVSSCSIDLDYFDRQRRAARERERTYGTGLDVTA